ncbi:hypothetical protein [Mangrovimonas sp. DI 80]|uniref:hypothetical protein n=1 Tax=Mangrovimonas sp. DI 80 TaxID=1779330 RepID=UPI000975B5CA|nr:hypothetical protein [Mangrovimonas sp. DI 80]OMP31162.1 hypothetical protein BKM32_08865 [Mangrovimonas sp. DI 80]
MSFFFKRLTNFFITLFSLACLLLLSFSLIVKSISKDYNLNELNKGLFVGDSHVRCAIDDSYIDGYINMGLYAESYYFSFFKIKQLLDRNDNIEEVYLGYSYHSLSNYYDSYVSGEYSKEVSSTYFFMLPLRGQLECLLWNLSEMPSYLRMGINKECESYFKSGEYAFRGGYVNNKIDMASEGEIAKRIKAQFYDKNVVRQFSKLNIDNLLKIIALCNERDIELTLVNMPLHRLYRKRIPAEYRIKFQELLDESNVCLIDLSALEMDDDCFIRDGDHLTRKGALKTTTEFIKLLK